MDRHNIHALTCERLSASSRNDKHDQIADVVRDIAVAADLNKRGFEVKLEPLVAPGHFNVRTLNTSTGRAPENKEYHADVGLYHLGSLTHAIDVSVAGVTPAPNSTQIHYGPAFTPQEAGAAARKREREKTQHYTHNTTMPERNFTPFVLETMGAWGEAAVNFVREMSILCTDTRSVKDAEYARIFEHNVRQVAFALQVGNARSLVRLDRRLAAERASAALAAQTP